MSHPPLKRDPALRELSVDHHHGLVLARRARRAAAEATEEAIREAWAEIERRFAEELEPHFRIEEEHLVPVLESLGEDALVKRLASDHASLRRLVQERGGRTARRLDELGVRLANHIRFEERELFDVVQRRFDAGQLAAVQDAVGARRGS